MRILVISDTHGKEEALKRLLELEDHFDLAIHLGDAEGRHGLIEQMLSCPLHAVRGNCDSSRDLPRDMELFLEGKRTLITHGHAYGVNYGITNLWSEANVRGCRIVMYGHTHRPMADEVRGIWMLNPGSLSEPRQADRRPSYLVLTIGEYGDVVPEVKFIFEN